MKRAIKAIILLLGAAGGIWLTTLLGCKSNETVCPPGTEQGGRKVTSLKMEFNWPPGSSTSRQDGSAGPPPAAPKATAQNSPPVMSIPPSGPAAVAWEKSPPASSERAQLPASAKPENISGPAPEPSTAMGAQSPPAAKPGYPPAQLTSGRSLDASEATVITEQERSLPATNTKPPVHLSVSAGEQSPSGKAQDQELSSGQGVEARILAQARSPGNMAVVQTSALPATESRSGGIIAVSAEGRSNSSFPSAASGSERSPARASSAANPRKPSPHPNQPALRIVNSKRVKLHFEVKDVGPSGLSGVDLWYTRDHQEWIKPNVVPQLHGPYVVEVPEEGLYGFTLIAHNSLGHGEPPPKAGDLPQVWVLVDLTAPVVKINSAGIVTDADGPKLTVAWTATDRFMACRPVTLSYAE